MSSPTQLKKKAARRQRRKRHLRQKLFGTAESPRLTVFRSHKHIYCQLINDAEGKTLTAASTRDQAVREALGDAGGKSRAAAAVGKAVAEKVKALGILRAQFDRNGYRFHGRIKALVAAAREAGLKV
jgi:large subunit ribosomal protein L18